MVLVSVGSLELSVSKQIELNEVIVGLSWL
jgi:hypothetical protein